jgi:hypothetical protein
LLFIYKVRTANLQPNGGKVNHYERKKKEIPQEHRQQQKEFQTEASEEHNPQNH